MYEKSPIDTVKSRISGDKAFRFHVDASFHTGISCSMLAGGAALIVYWPVPMLLHDCGHRVADELAAELHVVSPAPVPGGREVVAELVDCVSPVRCGVFVAEPIE